MSHIVEKWKAFCEWQRRPCKVAEKSPEWHRCRMVVAGQASGYEAAITQIPVPKATDIVRQMHSL